MVVPIFILLIYKKKGRVRDSLVLCSPGLLCNEYWLFLTDVSGQPIVPLQFLTDALGQPTGSIFILTLDDGNDRLSQNIGKKLPLLTA